MRWGGTQHTVALEWSAVDNSDEAFYGAWLEADGRTEARWGIESPVAGVTWIGVPSFIDPISQNTPAALSDIVWDLRARGARYRREGVIVVDLRGNGGGRLGAAHDLAEGLFGPQAGRRSRGLFMRTSSVFRISSENVDYLSERPGDPGAPAQTADDFAPFGWIFLGALRNGEASVTLGPRVERTTDGLTQMRRTMPPEPAADGARIYVLVNETCLSACLAFLDTAAFMPGVTIIGGITGEDGVLTWARQVALPEPGMWLSAPMVEWRGAARGAGEAYEPDFAYTGVWRDEDVRAWVLDLIARGETANE
jgi:hypothetical protein